MFTSNVDGAFEKAGYDPARIIECHGSIHWLQVLILFLFLNSFSFFFPSFFSFSHRFWSLINLLL